MYVIFKGDGWGGKREQRNYGNGHSVRTQDQKVSHYTGYAREEELHKRIQSGALSDRDIAEVEKSGGELLKEMKKVADKRTSELKNNPAYRHFGEGSFDGIDKDGNLYKDIPLNSL